MDRKAFSLSPVHKVNPLLLEVSCFIQAQPLITGSILLYSSSTPYYWKYLALFKLNPLLSKYLATLPYLDLGYQHRRSCPPECRLAPLPQEPLALPPTPLESLRDAHHHPAASRSHKHKCNHSLPAYPALLLC
jgi:hypothetical protein